MYVLYCMFFVRRLSPLAREGFGDRLPVGQGVVDVLLFRFSLFLRALPVCLDSATLRTAGFVFCAHFGQHLWLWNICTREVVLHRSLYVFLFAALSIGGAGLSNSFAMLFAKGVGDRRQATSAPSQDSMDREVQRRSCEIQQATGRVHGA